MDETKEIDIDLRKIIYMMRTKIIFIILITILFAAISGLYTHVFITPMYSTSVSMCVYSDTDRVTTDKSISSSELVASKDLVKSYIFILTQDPIMTQVANRLGNDESAASIRNAISATTVEDTLIFTVTVKHADPSRAVKIAKAIADVAPGEMKKVLKLGNVTIVNEEPKVPQSPSFPNTKKNISIGAIAGFIISFAGFFIYELFDTTITNAKDLERDFALPVLGTVPALDIANKRTETNDDASAPQEAFENSTQPSNQLLRNIQSMKGDTDYDKA